MTTFLLVTLYAPLSSWGDIAVGEARGSWDRPSRSGVLGLLAAAVGIEREDEERLDALDASVGIAVRLDAGGTPLSEYQTVQSISESLARRHKPATRRELLSLGAREQKLNTVLSRREFQQDAMSTIAVWLAESGPWSLADLKSALEHPHFTLYAGRKANVLGLPLNPQVVDASTLLDAFEHRAGAPVALASKRIRLMPREKVVIAHDECRDFESGLRELRREIRRDAHPKRKRWQFHERIVQISAVPTEN